MTGADIIKLKDEIHGKWFKLQATKRADKNHAFLEKPLYDQIVALGHQALDMVKTIEPTSPHIKRIEDPLHEVERQSWLVEDIAHLGYMPYYVMTPQRGKDIITRDINMLANAIHQAGSSLIRYSEEYGGCRIPEHLSLRSLNTGTLKYCEGALSLEGRRGVVKGEGDEVEHRPGSAATHANLIKFTPTEWGNDLEMEYIESGDSNWQHRQKGVIDYVTKRKGKCTTAESHTRCHIPDLPDEEILKLALLMSQLKDIDLMDDKCIPLAFELIEKQADELKEIEPKESIWEERWTRIGDFKEVMDCVEPGYEEEQERENREDILARRIERSISEMGTMIALAIDKSKTDPCTAYPYMRLDQERLLPGSMRDECARIKKETTSPFAWCQELADEKEREFTEAAKDLVSRCPPEAIILGCEAASKPYSIDAIADICELVENQACLDIIKQVEARAQAGIKPAKLALKFEGEL
jgi:hypothetical protein